MIVVLLAAWAIAQRTPGIIGQAADEWRAGRDGSTTDAADAARVRLVNAGVDPSGNGGPLRNFLGNLWRGYWHDKDQEREQQRAEDQLNDEQAWWRRRIDNALERQAAKYRGSTPEPPAPDTPPATTDDPIEEVIHPPEPKPSAGSDEASTPPGQPQASGPDGRPHAEQTADDRPPIRVPSTVGPEASGREREADAPRPIAGPGGWDGGPHIGYRPGGPPADDPPRSPLRILSTVGEPRADLDTAVAVLDRPDTQHHIEGNTTMGTAVATQGVAITSMTTGAYEMGSINARLQAAVNDFVAELTILQNRLVRAGESTLGTVQLSSRSTVMGSMSQSVEAISALKAAARNCSGEVAPLVQATRREFERRI